MANIIFRAVLDAPIPAATAAKGSPLTNLELDGNFRSLNDNKIEITDSIYLGTTTIALDRASGAQTLTGISIDGNAGTVTNGVYTNTTNTITGATIFRNSAGFRTEQADTKDSVIVQGGSGGTNSYSVTLIPATLSGNRTLTLPDGTGNLIYDAGSYSNPSWIASLSETKVLPEQTGQNGKYLTTNGTSTSWADVTTTTLDSLSDVVINSPSNGQVLKYNGTNWVNGTDATGTGGGGGGITTGTAIAMAIVFGG